MPGEKDFSKIPSALVAVGINTEFLQQMAGAFTGYAVIMAIIVPVSYHPDGNVLQDLREIRCVSPEGLSPGATQAIERAFDQWKKKGRGSMDSRIIVPGRG